MCCKWSVKAIIHDFQDSAGKRVGQNFMSCDLFGNLYLLPFTTMATIWKKSL